MELLKPAAVDPKDVPGIVDELREYFKTDATLDLNWRKNQLKGLIKCLDEHTQDWVNAMNKDMNTHQFEGELMIANVRSEIEYTLSNLEEWLYPSSCSQPWALYPGSTNVVPEPYGVVCNFIPYNYPMFLGFSTLLPILACGNVCLFKPSSNTPYCAFLYQTLFPQYLDPKAVRVVCGPTSICDHILECRFDFIFYTGSPKIARNVMAKASVYLTPTLLELGGKSPVYIDKQCKLPMICRRLLFGKVFNGGQTCVAPDYALVHQDVIDAFRSEMVAAIKEMYGDVSAYNNDITHIISERHFDRIERAIQTCNGKVVVEGFRDRSRLYIGPTLIEAPALDSQLMTEEIFGPVLPFVAVSGPEEAIAFIRAREKPLACYVLTSDEKVVGLFENRTSSGALIVNDVVFHVASPAAPFGGVGNSGMGQYHGVAGIQALSHMKPVVRHSTMVDISMKYPPYEKAMKWLPAIKKFA